LRTISRKLKGVGRERAYHEVSHPGSTTHAPKQLPR
jgi:hypothetical protein